MRSVGRASLAAAVLAALVALALGCGGGGKKTTAAQGQVVHFQRPTEAGNAPFTLPADVRGATKVDVGSGPYGGTGSDLVCDRELLIRSLRARPDRLRAWAQVVGIEPTFAVVAAYIRKLRPVTLTQDTRVTNHSFEGGTATAYQAILQAGTAVLVDSYGVPRARCRCGNPLVEPVFVSTARCYGCPYNYHPPPPCQPASRCYTTYPDPPPVHARTSTSTPSPPPPQTTSQPQQTSSQRQLNPAASFSPSSGPPGSTFTLSASGFPPNTSLQVTLVRPDGHVESYTIETGSDGSGSHTFPPDPSVMTGTYSARVRDPGSGAEASASVRVTRGQGAGAGSYGTGG
jgi:hypothetical protein